jgi:hypothetical protein
MEIQGKSDDGRVIWVDFPGTPPNGKNPKDDRPPPGSRRAPRGNPELDAEALERSLDGLDRAGGGPS